MRLIKCDNHPDRDAVTTLSIKILPAVGQRPLILGLEMVGKVVDLCEECQDRISPLLNVMRKETDDLDCKS